MCIIWAHHHISPSLLFLFWQKGTYTEEVDFWADSWRMNTTCQLDKKGRLFQARKSNLLKGPPPPTSSNRVNICFFWASAILCVYFYYRDLFVCMCLSLGCLTLGQAQVVSHWRFHKVMKWWDGGVCLGESSICHCFVIVLMVGGQVKYLTYILCASDDIHAGSVVAVSLQPHGL